MICAEWKVDARRYGWQSGSFLHIGMLMSHVSFYDDIKDLRLRVHNFTGYWVGLEEHHLEGIYANIWFCLHDCFKTIQLISICILIRWMIVSQLQPTAARHVYPCFDEPAMKATFNISIVHHPSYVALSNMLAVGK